MNLKSVAKLSVAALAIRQAAVVHAAPKGLRPTGHAPRDSVAIAVSGGIAFEVPAAALTSVAPPPPQPTASLTRVTTSTLPPSAAPSAWNAPAAPAVVAAAAPSNLSPIGAPDAGPNSPTIQVVNHASTVRYYTIEASVGSDPQALTGRHFSLLPGQSVAVNAGDGFNGAFTDHGSDPNQGGTRLEVNCGQAGKTWYDADLEYGNTVVTLGPTNTALKADDGRDSLVGNSLTPYYTAGAVDGKPESDLDKLSDLGTHVISTQKMTITGL